MLYTSYSLILKIIIHGKYLLSTTGRRAYLYIIPGQRLAATNASDFYDHINGENQANAMITELTFDRTASWRELVDHCHVTKPVSADSPDSRPVFWKPSRGKVMTPQLKCTKTIPRGKEILAKCYSFPLAGHGSPSLIDTVLVCRSSRRRYTQFPIIISLSQNYVYVFVIIKFSRESIR